MFACGCVGGFVGGGGVAEVVEVPLVSARLPVMCARSPRLTLSSHTGLI